MPRLEPEIKLSQRREHERGNIVLVAALMVLAFGGVGLGLTRMVHARMEVSTNMQLSNYGGTLALNVAESAINQVLYNWNAGVSAPNALGPLTVFPDLTTNYGRFTVTTTSTYSVTAEPVGSVYRLTAGATVSTTTGTRPAADWQVIARQVVATVSNSPPYAVQGYRR